MDHIMNILHSQGIACSCDRDKGLVFVLYENAYGAIFSIYAYREEQLVNRSIYELAVPDSSRKKVAAYLARLSEPAAITYYIDRETGCIALYGQCLSTNDRGLPNDPAAAFCRMIHRACITNQLPLYRLLHGS